MTTVVNEYIATDTCYGNSPEVKECLSKSGTEKKRELSCCILLVLCILDDFSQKICIVNLVVVV